MIKQFQLPAELAAKASAGYLPAGEVMIFLHGEGTLKFPEGKEPAKCALQDLSLNDRYPVNAKVDRDNGILFLEFED